MTQDIKEAAQRKGNKATFLQTLVAVLWSFFGIRSGKGHQEDLKTLNPIHVIIVGILAAAGFVVALLFIVKWVVAGAA